MYDAAVRVLHSEQQPLHNLQLRVVPAAGHGHLCAPCGLAGCADCGACTQGADCLNGRKCILKCQDKACAVCEKDYKKCQLCSPGSYLLPSGACKACGLDSCAKCQACSGGAGCTGGRKCVQKCADKRCCLCDGNAKVCKECAKNYYEDARTGGCTKVRVHAGNARGRLQAWAACNRASLPEALLPEGLLALSAMHHCALSDPPCRSAT